MLAISRRSLIKSAKESFGDRMAHIQPQPTLVEQVVNVLFLKSLMATCHPTPG